MPLGSHLFSGSCFLPGDILETQCTDLSLSLSLSLSSMLLNYNWQKINYIHLNCAIWYILLHVYAHKTITTIQRMNISFISSKIPLCPFVFLQRVPFPLSSLGPPKAFSIWKAGLGLVFRTHPPCTSLVFTLTLSPCSRLGTFSLAEGGMRGGTFTWFLSNLSYMLWASQL